MSKTVRLVALIAGIVTVGAGAWAFIDPQSFFEQVATFSPYNRHLIHDLGAFQIAIGVALVLATKWSGAMRVALWAASVGAVVHFVGHVEDSDLGGSTLDTVLIGLFALALAATTALNERTPKKDEGE